MNKRIINQWNKWYEKALKRYHFHKTVSIWFHQKNASLGFWVVIFTTITGTLGGTTIFERFLGGSEGKATSLNTFLLLFLAFFSVVTAILTALQKWFRYSEKSNKHKEAASEFEDLLMELDKFIISDFNDRQRVDFFKNINSKWKEIDKKAPLLPKLPERITETALKEYEEELQTKKEPPKVIRCSGSIGDLSISEADRIVEIPEDRKWSYEIKEATIFISSTEITLKYTLNVKRPDSSEIEVYHNEGKGLRDDSLAFIDYKCVKSNGIISWNGVMVLKILKMAEFKGFWITNILEDGRFAFGNIYLKAKERQVEE